MAGKTGLQLCLSMRRRPAAGDGQPGGGAAQLVPADAEAKAYALSLLRRAMDGDLDGVAAMFRDAVSVSLHLGVYAGRWLREGLMYEVLGIQPAPEPPLEWEGPYLESVETVEDFIKWIDQEFFARSRLVRTQGDQQGDGQAVRNAYRLVDKLDLLDMPDQAIGPLTVHQEEAVLRNLQRECRRRMAGGEEGGPGENAAGEGDIQRWLTHPRRCAGGRL